MRYVGRGSRWVLVMLLPVMCSFVLTSVACMLSMITSMYMCQLLFSVVCVCVNRQHVPSMYVLPC